MEGGAARGAYVIWFADIEETDTRLVGGKNAGLGALTRAGIAVPPGFAITSTAYRDFLAQSGAGDLLRPHIESIGEENPEAAQCVGAILRQTIVETPIPLAISREITAAYAKLCADTKTPDAPVAVRSSSTDESLPAASLAGQQETFLWVRTAGDVVRSTLSCWASLFTPRALVYRRRLGIPLDGALISVGIQMMVDARVAGIAFTLNPANGDRSKIAIEASWGLGTAVASGTITPDRWLVDKVTAEIVRREIAVKNVEHVVDGTASAMRFLDVPPERAGRPCLEDEEILAVARVAAHIESHYGSPQDIEWAIVREQDRPAQIAILQNRPETAWSRRAAEPMCRPMSNAVDYVVDTLMPEVQGSKFKVQS